jgi:hypothetical protein
MFLTLGLAFVCYQAYVGPAGPEIPGSRHPAIETPRLLTPERAGAERAVRRVPARLTDAQLFAARIIAAAFVANLASGRDGAGSLTLATVGGSPGNWLLPEPIAESLSTDDTNGKSYPQPPSTGR